VFSAAPTCLDKTPFESMGRSYASAYISLAQISSLAKGAEVTVNDVCLTVCDMGMRAYLTRMGDKVAQPLVASVPVSTRSDEDAASSNAATLAQTKLGDALLAPLPRLKQISANMHALKKDLRGMPAMAQNVMAMSTFGVAQLGDLPLLNSALPLTSNLLISNIPPQGEQPLYMGGGRLARMHGLPILPQNHSLNITLAAYAGELCFGIVASSDVIPDAWPLAQDLQNAFAQLQRACKIRKAPARARTAGKPKTKA
jgi:WS/DGAT/MGAT family acyltransferase